MIKVNDLYKRFGRTRVLNGINLECESSQCVALIGPNACGKTTLIKSILGMVIPDSGTISFNGTEIGNSYAYRQQIGYMPQIGHYPENMSVEQIIEIIKEIRGYSVKYDDELLEEFRLKQHFNKRMCTLSGGTTQKVSAVLAFLFNPPVLVLDEPTAGLDPLSAEILKEKIHRENQNGKLILVTSHLLNELDELITEVVFMLEGRIKFHKGINNLKTETATDKVSKAIAIILKQTNG